MTDLDAVYRQYADTVFRFLLAKLAVGSAMDIMTGIFSVCGSVVQTVMNIVDGLNRKEG